MTNPNDPVQTTTQGNIMQSPIDNLQSSIHNAPLPPSTGIDTMRQNAAKCGENSCARTRGSQIPAFAGMTWEGVGMT